MHAETNTRTQFYPLHHNFNKPTKNIEMIINVSTGPKNQRQTKFMNNIASITFQLFFAKENRARTIIKIISIMEKIKLLVILLIFWNLNDTEVPITQI